jgi:hypothetical protein
MGIQKKNLSLSKSKYKCLYPLIGNLRNVAEAMTNNVSDAVRRFLDIEAQVDGEEDDDRYGDGPGPGELTLVFSMGTH